MAHPPKNSSDAAVTVHDVSMIFSEYRALEEISVTIPCGAFVAVIGPNGGGKTTLLHVILGITKPTTGSVKLFGETPSALPSREVGYVPQRKTLETSFPATVLELVVTGLRGTWPWRVTTKERAAACEALERTGVGHVAMLPVGKLSGGQLQRVYLARALVRRPKLMILDEPAAGMDVVGEAAMYHLLADYQKETGATVLMITHDWEGARCHASDVLLLNRRVIGFGAPDVVAREENLLQAFGHAGHVKATHADDQAGVDRAGDRDAP